MKNFNVIFEFLLYLSTWNRFWISIRHVVDRGDSTY